MKNKVSYILTIVLAVMLLFNSCGYSGMVEVPEQAQQQNQTEAVAEMEQEAEVNVPSAESSAKLEKGMPDSLFSILQKSGLDESAVSVYSQLITVTEEFGSTYTITCYENQQGNWAEAGIENQAYVGGNGVTARENKREGDQKTPRGLYPLGFAFGLAPNPGTSIEYRNVTNTSYWVDDVNSQYYNQWVDSSEASVTWSSAEKLADHPSSYKYGVVVEYNTDPIVKGNGSAIFLHVGSNPTLGCIATSEATMVSILKWLNNDAAILIY